MSQPHLKTPADFDPDQDPRFQRTGEISVALEAETIIRNIGAGADMPAYLAHQMVRMMHREEVLQEIVAETPEEHHAGRFVILSDLDRERIDQKMAEFDEEHQNPLATATRNVEREMRRVLGAILDGLSARGVDAVTPSFSRGPLDGLAVEIQNVPADEESLRAWVDAVAPRGLDRFKRLFGFGPQPPAIIPAVVATFEANLSGPPDTVRAVAEEIRRALAAAGCGRLSRFNVEESTVYTVTVEEEPVSPCP